MAEFPIPRDGYLSFDAFTLKQHIKNALNKSGIFTDQNYDGSFISTIIDIIAYTFHVLMFYLNKNSTETMFTEAQLYENINRIVKMLDYKPLGNFTSILSFDVQAGAAIPVGSYVIPRYSYIIANNIPFSFIEDISFIKNQENKVEILEDVGKNKLLYQGVWREYPLYTAVGDLNELIYLTPGKNIIIDHYNIDVYIKPANTQKWEKWDRTMSLYLENGYHKVYEIRYNEDKQYEIKFGNNINGLKLNQGDQVAIYYLETKLKDGEVGVYALRNKVMNTFKSTQFLNIMSDLNQSIGLEYVTDNLLAELSFNNGGISTYSSTEENVETIRQNAPGVFRSQYRLVTEGDYYTYITTNFSRLVHDVKIFNNWAYLSQYLKYFYDLGLTNPDNISRVLYNQLNFADACNFNNVYAFIVPKAVSDSVGISYLSPANKQLIISTTDSIKTLTSETIILDPVYLGYSICAPVSDPTIESADNSYLKIIKDPMSKRDDLSIVQDVALIFQDYFRRDNTKLGQTIDLIQMTSDILNVPGVKKIYTVSESTESSFEGISFLQWNVVYPEADMEVIFNNRTLSNFMFPLLIDEKLLSGEKIKVESSTKKYQAIEY